MKIVHIVDSLDRGGQETFLVNLAIEQKKSGHEVIIISFKEEGVLANVAINNGIDVKALSTSTDSILSTIKALKGIINRIEPDIIHTHNRRPLFFTFFAVPTERKKIINTRHGNGVRGLYWSLAAIFSNKIINVSDDLFSASNWLNRELLKNKNQVIKNGILIGDKVSNGQSIGQLIMVGRLNQIKNHLLALKVVKQCLLQGVDVSLKIVGDGEEKQSIEEEIKKLGIEKNVSLMGDRSDVNDLLLESDIFVMTSLSEGHSIALLEACAAGIPAVVSKVGGNGEIVQDEKTGFVLELDDIDGFVDAIVTLTKDREVWAEMSVLTRQWVNENASMHSCAENYYDAYNS